MAEVTLLDALEGIQSSVAKNRNQGYSDLKHVVRHNQAILKDESYHSIFDVLFRAAVSEQANLVKAKTASTRTLAENKLSAIASALRTTVEAGAAVLGALSTRAVLDHIMDTICFETGEVCEPIGPDYAKSMRAILSHQPHVELMNQTLKKRPEKEWDRIAGFCARFVREHTVDDSSLPELETMSAVGSSANVLSSRSSRSTAQPVASQRSRTTVRSVADEMVGCVRLLTAVPNPPLQKQAESLLSTVTEYLRTSNTATRSHQDGFTAVNQLLAWTRTEKIQLTRQTTSLLLRLIKVYWSGKSPALAQMTTTLLLLRPYIMQVLLQPESLVLRPELVGLLQTIQSEYSNRHEHQQLSADDLVLEVNTTNGSKAGKVATILFALRRYSPRSDPPRWESNWLQVHTLAWLHSRTMKKSSGDIDSDRDDSDAGENDDAQPPRKRQRRNGHHGPDDLSNLLDATTSGTPRSRICALQVLAFLAQQTLFTPTQLIDVADSLAISCNDEVGNLSTWAMLALTCCASQTSATNTKLLSRWSAAWQVACRALGNASTCRAASYLLYMFIQLRLVPQSSIAELVQTATTAMDLSGPSSLTDSVALLLTAILNYSQQVNPESASATAESILRWLTHAFTPSKIDDKQITSGALLYDVADVVSLVTLCMGRQPHRFKAAGLPVWGPLARAWLVCEEQEDLVSYLLLNVAEDSPIHPDVHQQILASRSPTSARSASSEILVLTHMLTEATRANEAWSASVIRNPSQDSFAMLCKACHVFTCISSCIAFRDARRQSQLQEQADALTKSLSAYVGTTRCDLVKADAFLSALSTSFSGLEASRGDGDARWPQCETLICRAIVKSTDLRRTAKDSIDVNDDTMDLDDAMDSQESRLSHIVASSIELASDLDVDYSSLTLRASAALYANVVVTQENEQQSNGNSPSVSTAIVDFLLDQPEASLMASRNIIAVFPNLGLILSADDTERLLGMLGDSLKKPEKYRSEVVLGTLLDVMHSLTAVWTHPSDNDLYDLGLKLYNWFVDTALRNELLSRSSQQRLATLLLRLCQNDVEYPQHSDAVSARSCLSSLFELLQRGSITAQYHVAGDISAVFGRSILSTHRAMFEDLSGSLPEDIEHVEGMAIRLLFFVKLASKWQTLLPWCVYRIFEAGSTPHAARCIIELANNLPLQSPRSLFALFAPHLLFNWLAPRPSKEHSQDQQPKSPWPLGMGMPLKELPYSAFQYSSLNELLVANQSEVCAQMIMFGDKDGMDILSKAARMLPKSIAKSAFARSFAYAMAYDIRMSTGLPSASRDRENYLRDLVGGKEEFAKLAALQWSTIQGYFYLTTQQEDPGDKWLEKHPKYSPQVKILKEIKQYSHSARQIPNHQEPVFTSTKLCDQLDRLGRRTTSQAPTWTPSTFVLTARMLLDAIDDALGSLHACLLIRRLRLLVCMAGDVALSGFALEMLIHSLRPFMNDSECADDTLGILQYLFNYGRDHLRTNPSFLGGTTALLILQLRQHSKTQQRSTTQESQHTATVHKMLQFQKWLVQYLAKNTSDDQGNSSYTPLIRALDLLQMPGNARKSSPESALLLFMLDQWPASEPLCTSTDCLEALGMLAKGFEAPRSTTDDCLGSDESSIKYAQPLWEISSKMVKMPMTQDFTTWSARVLGRAYASAGIRPSAILEEHSVPKLLMPANLAEEARFTFDSHTTIAQKWSQLLFSRRRTEAGLAEHTLRKLADTIDNKSPDTDVFALGLPEHILAAIQSGICGYEPPSADQHAYTVVEDDALCRSLQTSATQTIEEWTTDLAVTVCRWAPKVTVVACLATLLHNIPGLAVELLPSMLHILLVQEIGGKETLRSELSTAITSHLIETDPALHSKQQFWLKLLLYLRSQQYPNEATKADRHKWLDVDYLIAADAGARCGMPQCALLLAESIAPVAQANKRSSSRASLSQLHRPPVADDLLLSIYQQLEEPDSFYGVQQPASLDNVLNRLDHEADGLRSLMFRSAQMDSHMRRTHRLADSDAVGMVHSLSALNFNSLALALLTHGLGNSSKTSGDMMGAAQALQQWDIALPETSTGATSTTFSVFQELSRASLHDKILDRVQVALIDHTQQGLSAGHSAKVSHSWFGILASLTEIEEILSSVDQTDMASRWSVMQSRSEWMHMARYEDIKLVLSSRQTLFGVLAQNTNLQQKVHVNQKQARSFEVEALLAESRFAREHSHLQEALAATTTLSNMVSLCESMNLNIAGAVKFETASVLWDAGETSASVKMLRDTLSMPSLDEQDIAVGSAGLRAQLAHQLAEARLEKPDVIYKLYLKPAISDLKSTREGQEAGKVFYEFAKFCDDELQVPGNIEAFERISKMRREKEEEVDAIKMALNRSRSDTERRTLMSSLTSAKGWRDLDIQEEHRLTSIRSQYVQQSLQNYLLALAASDEHDICVLRFFALWLEYSDDEGAMSVVRRFLKDVPSWKFVLLMNQLMSRVSGEQSLFQTTLADLMLRIFIQHPHHSLHHLFANAKNARPSGSDAAALSRYNGARRLYESLKQEKATCALMQRLFRCDELYRDFANSTPEKVNNSGKFSLNAWHPTKSMREYVTTRSQPPITMTIPLRPSGRYEDLATVVKFNDTGSILGGLSAPKLITAIGSDGRAYKQIFKNGKDDLRQDAIMEQVFEEVSKMLRHHKPTRQRDLKIRTYKVIPLAPGAGVIEFVPNSMPLMDYVKPAHQRYHPQDMHESKARSTIKACEKSSDATRLSEFRKICEHMHPILRHFFLERFDNPDEWFEKRTAYTRTTASMSILGHIIGLGDRHCSNILLDEVTGEVIHIDLGVSFEAGRVLPIPEKVPFRLTRDIVDGMGVTKTEGVFRRCCEFTLDAVRDDKDSIMTLLNVLRYDPLYNWTVSPLRAKRLQAEETGRNGGEETEMSSRKGDHDGEAVRPLQVVEKKLSKGLSTAATVNELIQQATDELNLATLFVGWAAYY